MTILAKTILAFFDSRHFSRIDVQQWCNTLKLIFNIKNGYKQKYLPPPPK